jgi:hypothetical protein
MAGVSVAVASPKRLEEQALDRRMRVRDEGSKKATDLTCQSHEREGKGR